MMGASFELRSTACKQACTGSHRSLKLYVVEWCDLQAEAGG